MRFEIISLALALGFAPTHQHQAHAARSRSRPPEPTAIVIEVIAPLTATEVVKASVVEMVMPGRPTITTSWPKTWPSSTYSKVLTTDVGFPHKWPLPHSDDRVVNYFSIEGPPDGLPDCWRQCLLSEGNKTYIGPIQYFQMETITVDEFCRTKLPWVVKWFFDHLIWCIWGFNGRPGECQNGESMNNWVMGLCGHLLQ